MKINIAASHRFHMLDLARELAAIGHEVKFYSYVPTWRCVKYGLKRKNCCSLFYLMLPLILLSRLLSNKPCITGVIQVALDYTVAWFMPECDVFIGLGTVYKKSFYVARKKFNALTILEWGSKHVTDQQEILEKIMGRQAQHRYFNDRSIAGYEAADFIAVPADHAYQTFKKRGIDERKLIVNSYGVDLRMFYPTRLEEEKKYDLIAVGAWSLQKGSDLLVDLCTRENLSLLHVGPIVDVRFPKLHNMTHIDPVDQSQLVRYYAKAKIFIHPSRQDGLAMVQCQAIACGLPIVCSKNSGGRDLKLMLPDPQWIIEIDNLSVDGILSSLDKAFELTIIQSKDNVRNYAKAALNQLTWQAYASRYNNYILNLLSKNVK